MNHFMGSGGGRVLPLYRDRAATSANVTPGLVAELRRRLRVEISALDLFAYIAAVTAHPAYSVRFALQLKNPGVRIPLTADSELWEQATKIGRELLWLHTFGERCADEAAGRPSGIPRMSLDRPKVLVTIPDTEEGMPDKIVYDEHTAALKVALLPFPWVA